MKRARRSTIIGISNSHFSPLDVLAPSPLGTSSAAACLFSTPVSPPSVGDAVGTAVGTAVDMSVTTATARSIPIDTDVVEPSVLLVCPIEARASAAGDPSSACSKPASRKLPTSCTKFAARTSAADVPPGALVFAVPVMVSAVSAIRAASVREDVRMTTVTNSAPDDDAGAAAGEVTGVGTKGGTRSAGEGAADGLDERSCFDELFVGCAVGALVGCALGVDVVTWSRRNREDASAEAVPIVALLVKSMQPVLLRFNANIASIVRCIALPSPITSALAVPGGIDDEPSPARASSIATVNCSSPTSNAALQLGGAGGSQREPVASTRKPGAH
jgi:hypothetical protein